MAIRRAVGAAAFAVASIVWVRPAGAQVHWDAGVELGLLERLTTGRGPNVPAPTPGPVGELHAHVALFPMLRVGAYVVHDISPVSGGPAREVTEAGLRVKLSPPLLSGQWRDWSFVGVGVARVYLPGHETAGSTVAGTAGGILDLPFGVGIGYRLRRPWEIFAELEGRVGLAFAGPLYSKAEAQPYGGQDSFAVSLSLGVSWDE